MAKFTIGSDPEFILIKNDKVYSAIPIIKSPKDKKTKIGEYYFFYDNVLAECSMPAASSKIEFVRNVGHSLKLYSDLVKPYEIEARAAHVYDKSQLKHKKAKEIGCSAEICTYQMELFKPDEQLFQKTNLRSAGGHVHLGSSIFNDGYNDYIGIRLLDLFLGIPSIFLDKDDTSFIRKQLYGKAGRFRRPEYGIKYRSIGNFWLTSPKLVEIVYDICDFVIDFIEQGKAGELWEIDEERLLSPIAWADHSFHPSQCHKCKYNIDEMRSAIDEMSQELGSIYMDLIKNYMPADLFNRIVELSSNPEPYDLYKEWNLND